MAVKSTWRSEKKVSESVEAGKRITTRFELIEREKGKRTASGFDEPCCTSEKHERADEFRGKINLE